MDFNTSIINTDRASLMAIKKTRIRLHFFTIIVLAIAATLCFSDNPFPSQPAKPTSANSFAVPYNVSDSTIPGPVKSYTVTFTVPEWTYIDSILAVSQYYVGRQMNIEQGEPLKQAFVVVVNAIRTQLQKQSQSETQPLPHIDSSGKKDDVKKHKP